ncbi:carbon-nitrogen hydrolase family protein [Candidatus Thorarchaeota archaeon]|nr:MAG: carbon-nitrogen hydrolase family protein [Candidatus Thorarchaeota archaeon]
MSRRLGVAGLQLSKSGNGAVDFQKFENAATKTKESFPWVDLIFTGELYLQEYGTAKLKDHAQPIPNNLTDQLSEMAKKLECWLVPGSFLELDGSEVYNTALVFNPEGKIVAKYRKIFPWMPHEKTGWGTDFVTFDIPKIGRIGIVICYDLWFPELFRTLSWMGAEVILQPSLTYTSDRPAELVLAQAQAIMHQCYVLNVNVVSARGGGDSIWVDPEGLILEKTGNHDATITNVIDFDKVSWVRQHGHFGLNPVWKSLRDSPLQGKFPPYQNFQEGEIFKGLGKLKMQSSIREWKD